MPPPPLPTHEPQGSGCHHTPPAPLHSLQNTMYKTTFPALSLASGHFTICLPPASSFACFRKSSSHPRPTCLLQKMFCFSGVFASAVPSAGRAFFLPLWKSDPPSVPRATRTFQVPYLFIYKLSLHPLACMHRRFVSLCVFWLCCQRHMTGEPMTGE